MDKKENASGDGDGQAGSSDEQPVTVRGLLCSLFTFFRENPALVGSLFIGAFILSGILYSVSFYVPIGIPILDLSAPADFLLPGLRHSLVTFVVSVLTTVFAIVAVARLVWFLKNLFTVLLQILRIVLKSILIPLLGLLVIAAAGGSAIFAIPAIFRIIFCKTIEGILEFLRGKFRAKFRGDNIKNIIAWITDKYLSDIESLREKRENIKRLWSEGWKNINGIVNEFIRKPMDYLREKEKWWQKLIHRRRYVLILSVSALLAIVAILDKASFDRTSLESMLDAEAGEAEWSSQVYEDWLSPVSRVDVQFQGNGNVQENLLHLGVTSDFMFFWSKDPDNLDNSGGALIVPKVSVLGMVPHQEGSGPDPTPPPPIPANPDLGKIRQLLESSYPSFIREMRALRIALLEAIGDKDMEYLARFAADAMECNTDKPEMFALILFAHKSDEVGDQQRIKIKQFTDRLDRFTDGDTNLKVFGFASADGSEASNGNLADSRAKNVVDEMEQFCARDNISCPPFNADNVTEAVGEDHSINGVANSRSAVIAVCNTSQAV